MVQTSLLRFLTFHNGVSGLSSPDTQRLEDLLQSVLGLILGREDEGGGLLAAVTHLDGGQQLVEVGTLGCHLQSGGGRHQSGPPVDVNSHDWTELRRDQIRISRIWSFRAVFTLSKIRGEDYHQLLETDYRNGYGLVSDTNTVTDKIIYPSGENTLIKVYLGFPWFTSNTL